METKVRLNIKPELAIARIFAAIIYADGFLSQQELEFLEDTLKPKYDISSWDFQRIGMCSFSNAIHTILSPQGRRWLENLHLTVLSLMSDMEMLAQCDAQITPKEALICLCARLALETPMCSIVAYHEDNLRFSKSDIIYVEPTEEDAINKEINDQYDNIQYILHNFGYNFIYIPKVREEMVGYSDSYRRHLLQLLFPEDKHQEELDAMILTRMPVASSVGFSEMLFDEFLPQGEFSPSLLIKMPSTQSLRKNAGSDFALIKIEGNILQTIQTFFHKYNALAGKNYLHIQNGNAANMFQYRGFHRTFIEYLRNIVTDIQIHIQNKIVIRYGTLGDVHLPHRLLAAYLTVLYLDLKQKPLCKDWKQINEQYAIYKKIYAAFQPYTCCEKDDFYTNMQIDYGKIANQHFGKLPNKYLQKMVPLYDRAKQIFYFHSLPPVQVVKYSVVGTPSAIPFVDWVEGLKE